jgi:hypothetical protein
MNNLPKILTVGIASLVMFGLASCRSTQLEAESPQLTETQASTSATLASQSSTSQPQKSAPTSPVVKEATAATNTLPVTIYRVDSQCSQLVPEQVTVSQENAIEDAVAKTLEIQPGFELPLGYRVEVDDYYQIAVIDLRVSTTSRRSLYSLSACEQLALFGSLRETLTTNPNWEIKEVYFTNLGEDLVL